MDSSSRPMHLAIQSDKHAQTHTHTYTDKFTDKEKESYIASYIAGDGSNWWWRWRCRATEFSR